MLSRVRKLNYRVVRNESHASDLTLTSNHSTKHNSLHELIKNTLCWLQIHLDEGLTQIDYLNLTKIIALQTHIFL